MDLMDAVREAADNLDSKLFEAENDEEVTEDATVEDAANLEDEAGTESDETEDETAQDETEIDEDEDVSEESEEVEGPVKLEPEQEVVINGQTVKVSDALAMKADYTRKTQEAAQMRKDAEALKKEASETYAIVEKWYADTLADPTDLVMTSLSNTATDPVEFVVALSEKAGYKADEFASAVFGLLYTQNRLSPQFLATLGMEEPSSEILTKAQLVAQERKLKRIEQKERAAAENAAKEANEKSTKEQSAKQIEDDYNQQFATIIQEQGIAEGTQEEEDLQQELLAFIMEADKDPNVTQSTKALYLNNLGAAFTAMQLQKAKQAAKQPAKKAVAQQTTPRKKVAAPRTPQPRSNKGTFTGSQKPNKTLSIEDAVMQNAKNMKLSNNP